MSRPLPSSPSLEYLRRSAKRLASDVRAGEPGAVARAAAVIGPRAGTRFPLAHAQHVVAREAGFRSWAALRHALEMLAADRTVRAVPTRLQALTVELLTLARSGRSEELGQRFALMPLRDILGVRDRLVERGEHADLVTGLLGGLAHPSARVRYDCALALDHLADARCADPLRRLLGDPVPRVRRAALHSLTCQACKVAPITVGSQTDPDVELVIALATGDPSVRVRRTAVEVLGEWCGVPAAREVLERLGAEDADAGVRARAERGLRARPA